MFLAKTELQEKLPKNHQKKMPKNTQKIPKNHNIKPPNDNRDVVVNAGHLIVNVEYLIPDTAYFIIDSMYGFQNLCSYHPDLFICQFVQSRQRIFYLSLSNQLLQVFF
jgi:hypothetical protein